MNTPLPVAAPAALDPATLALIQRKLALENRLRNGLSWFYLIGGMSLLNSVIYLFGGTLTFVVGLAATQFVDGFMFGFAQQMDNRTVPLTIGFVVDVLIAGVFVAAGYLGRKKYRWVVVVGMGLYLLDALLFVWVGSWLAVAFHAYALFGLWQGLQGINGLRQLEAQGLPPAALAATLEPVVGRVQATRNQKFLFFALIAILGLSFLTFLALLLPRLIGQ